MAGGTSGKDREAESRFGQAETSWTGVDLGEILGPNVGYVGKIGLEYRLPSCKGWAGNWGMGK